jgi:hypothetical protein
VGTLFGNTAFIGFPLVVSAYGDTYLSYAALFNAIYVPVIYLVTVLVLSLGHKDRKDLGSYLKSVALNPVVLGAVAGLLASLIIHQGNLAEHVRATPGLSHAVEVVVASMKMVGNVGLVLALLAVGAALHFEYIRGHVVLMTLASVGKLLVMPALAFAICRWGFPNLQPEHAGAIVLLSGTPVAVGLYVMTQEMETDSDFMAGTLVLSTVLAALTIPFWLMLVG